MRRSTAPYAYRLVQRELARHLHAFASRTPKFDQDHLFKAWATISAPESRQDLMKTYNLQDFRMFLRTHFECDETSGA